MIYNVHIPIIISLFFLIGVRIIYLNYFVCASPISGALVLG